MVTATTDPRPATLALEVLRKATSLLTVGELARALGVHPTTARFHLDRLEAAGRVVTEPGVPEGRGRPALRYRVLDVADARVRMIEALAEATSGDGTGVERAEQAGKRWGAALEPSAEGVAAVHAAFAAMGFAPADAADGLRLRACPFLEAARRNQEVICAVHLGLAREVAHRAGVRGAVALVPFAQGGCRLTVGA